MIDEDKIKELEEKINKLYKDMPHIRYLSKQTIRISTKDKKTITVKI